MDIYSFIYFYNFIKIINYYYDLYKFLEKN